jgi:predicted MFS family arabinose efflux permease
VWQDVLRVSVLPALVAAFVIWVLMRDFGGEAGGAVSTRAYLASLASLMKRRMLFVLVLVTALRSMGHSAVIIFLPVYLREDLEFSATKVAIYLSLAQVAGIGAQPAMGFLSDRYGRKFVLMPAMTVLGVSFFALALADPGVQLTLTVLATGVFLYALHALFIATAMDVAGEGEVQSTVVSLVYGASFLGTFSPVLAGVVADARGTPAAFLFAGSLVFLATLILAAARLPKTLTQVAMERTLSERSRG